MQMKELETKHHIVDEEHELERKAKRTALGNGDVRSLSISAGDKARLNLAPKKKLSQIWPVELTTF